MGHWFMTAVYVMEAIVVFVHVVTLTRRLARSAFVCKVREAPHVLRHGLRWFCRQFRHEEEEEENEVAIHLLVQKRMEAEVVKGMRSMAVNFAHMYVCFTAIVLSNIYRGIESRWMTPGQDATLLFVTCLHTFLYLFPSLIRSSTVRTLYLTQMVIGVLFVIFSSDEQLGTISSITGAFTMRVAWSMAYLDPVAITSLNTLVSVACLIAYSALYSQHLRMLVVYEAVAFVVTIVMSRSTCRSRAFIARQEIATTTLKGESHALTTLLNLVCDVVVELDKALHVVEDSPKLSALLTLGGRTKSLKGAKLQDFMLADEDRERFEQRLLEPAGGGETSGEDQAEFLPGALPVKMRDSLGNILNIELLYAQCYCLGQQRFFLGLREISEEPVSQLRGFERRRSKRRSSREAGVQDRQRMAQALLSSTEGALGATAGAEAAGARSSGSGSEQGELSGELSGSGSEGEAGSRGETAQEGRLMNPSWRPIRERGKVLVAMRAMAKCNLLVGPTWCCPWHAAVADMQTTLAKFEGYECARTFGVKGGWQCSKCLSVETMQKDGEETGPGAGTGTEVCSICSYATLLRRRVVIASL